MESNVGGMLVLAVLLVAVSLTSYFITTPTTTTGLAIRDAADPAGERARTVLEDLSDNDIVATGKRLSLDLKNIGLASVSDYANMDVIVEYQSNDTGAMVYRRLTYATSTTIANPQPITLDSVSSTSTTSAASSLTFSHTVGNHPNRILTVGTQGEDSSSSDCEVTSVTYNGAPLTKVAEVTEGTSTFLCVGMWYLLAPDTGTNDVVITWNGNVSEGSGGATSIYNAAQRAPEAQASQTLNSDTTIYLFYDNSGISSSQEDVPGVWSNDYEAVLHLQESGGGNDDEFVDDSGNGHHGTGGGVAGSGNAARTPAQVTGKFGFAQDFASSTDDHIRLDTVSDQAWTAVTGSRPVKWCKSTSSC